MANSYHFQHDHTTLESLKVTDAPYPGLCLGPFAIRPPSTDLLGSAWSWLGSTNLNTWDAPNCTFIPLCSIVVSEMRCPST